MRRSPAKHRVLLRSLPELEARDPSLINLPLPVNSVPVVGPLASPLIGNGNGNGNGNGGGNGGGNGNGNGNGAGGGAQPPPPPTPQPAPMSTAGSGGGNGNGGGGVPTPTNTSPGGGGALVPPVSIISKPISGSASPPGKSLGSSSAQYPTGGGSTVISSSSGGSGNYLATGGPTAPINVGTTSATLSNYPAAQATGFSLPLQSSPGSGSDIVGTGVPSPTIPTTAATLSDKRLSGGAIAGITIACLFLLLALVLLVVRRRSIARRMELRRQWWFGRTASDGNFSPVNPRSPPGSDGEPASRLSARSSFATNFDQGLMFRADSPSRIPLGVVPDLPPMAEVRERNSVLISTGAAVARRESINSMLSNGSDLDTQYLTLSTGHNSTAMSVRPFSPSESFAFPKPPAPSSSTMDAFYVYGTQAPASSQSSVTTLVHLSPPPLAFMADLPPASAKTPPFPHSLMPGVTSSPFSTTAVPFVDPFTDPVKPEFADFEVIRRPFAPSLDDEMKVHPGDRVRLLQIFDDGWAFVDKLPSSEVARHERGLIPVDCLREANQTLPTFLAQKRVSYGSMDHLVGNAL